MASETVGGSERGGERADLKGDKVYKRKLFKGAKTNVVQSQTIASGEAGVSGKELDVDSSRPDRPQAVDGGDSGFYRQENRVIINLASKSKKEIREYQRKLEAELVLVRDSLNKIETKEAQVTGNDVDNSGRRKKRLHSEVEPNSEVEPIRTLQTGPLNQLSISVLENIQGASENVGKEKRTPKANQLYRNKDFLLGNDKFSSGEKKSTKGGGSKKGSEEGFGLGKFSNKFFKSCTSLLERLMRHKFGWVFNKPVDVKTLGLHDYFDIIKNPMDLGTVKSKLKNNLYKTPRVFAEDVRLTFENAMTYNPKGQDVYIMAEQLSQIFEEKWNVIEAEYLEELKLVVDKDGSLPTPTSRKAHTPRQPPAEMKMVLEGSESIDLNTRLVNLGHSGRAIAPKKPKAKDPNKREMTYAEKQKLSLSLQSLPADKLETVVEIIKKRNSSLSQNDDEIEVDIESFDTETLWELDRFVINQKKNLSKNKKSAELTDKAQPVHNEHSASAMNLVEEAAKENVAGKDATSTTSPVVEEQVNSSSSSSGNSDSSSSDSDSGSSE